MGNNAMLRMARSRVSKMVNQSLATADGKRYRDKSFMYATSIPNADNALLYAAAAARSSSYRPRFLDLPLIRICAYHF
jgi:hypothetical protein